MTVNKAPLSMLKVMESTERNTSLEGPETQIIVVDDEPVICQQLERLYSHSGYSVTIANSADEALQRLESRNIDLVVTDIRLPGLSGIDLTKRIVEDHAYVRVIVFTGYGDIDTGVEVLKLGASDYFL